MKDFDKWNNIKKSAHNGNIIRSFKDRDIFYVKVGANIGFEQDGKGEEFLRPVLILKKFGQHAFLGIPYPPQTIEVLITTSLLLRLKKLA